MGKLYGIPSAPRGIPQIEVTFTVDAKGVLSVSARDKLTHESHEIRIEGADTGSVKLIHSAA